MLTFETRTVYAQIILPNGRNARRPVEIRTHPITGRTCRITYSRSEENEPETERLPDPPPFAEQHDACPFCRQNLEARTPRLLPGLEGAGHRGRGTSILFPNLFPYGQYSAVSLFDDQHFVEIGNASPQTYADSFINCRDYLLQVLALDPQAIYMAITQNHLPSAGGSLMHPHLQVQADRIPANRQRALQTRASDHRKQTGKRILAEYLKHEQADGRRLIGTTGPWNWLAAFAPQGFFEIWGILPQITSINHTENLHWLALAQGVINAQKYYRSLGRNGYNFGLLLIEDGSDDLELRAVMRVRSNYAPWTRSDMTGFEVMLGDMATFHAPEQIAEEARPYWT